MNLHKLENTGRGKAGWADLLVAVENTLGLIDQHPEAILRHASHLHAATGGVIGDLTGMVHKLAMEAVDNGTERLDLDTVFGTVPAATPTRCPRRHEGALSGVANVRPLPVMVQPLAAETITGYLGRLATANALTPRELRLHVTDLAGLSPSHPNLERAAEWAERLGGLKPGHFAGDAPKNAMYVRCQHYAWQPTLCRRCGYKQAARTACRRCVRGEQTSVRSRGGAVCTRHRRWHFDGADIDLTGKRGIGLTTGELQLAASPIRYWSIEERLDGRIADRMATIGIDSLHADSVFLVAYPEIVRLTTILTDLSFASYLLSPRFSIAEQVWALEAAVVTVMQGCTTPRLHQVAERIVARGKAAVETAFSMRQNANNKRPATLEKALVASSQRHRSCLLRHLSTVRIQILPYDPGVAAPSNCVLVCRHPLPDLVDA